MRKDSDGGRCCGVVSPLFQPCLLESRRFFAVTAGGVGRFCFGGACDFGGWRRLDERCDEVRVVEVLSDGVKKGTGGLMVRS